MLHPDLLDSARSLSDRIVALRRAIHAEPELGLQTPRTSAKCQRRSKSRPLGGAKSGRVIRVLASAARA